MTNQSAPCAASTGSIVRLTFTRRSVLTSPSGATTVLPGPANDVLIVARERALPGRHREDDLDDERGTDVEGEVRHDVTQAVMDDQGEQPSGSQERHGRTQGPPTSECGTRGDQSDRRSERDEHRVIQHL